MDPTKFTAQQVEQDCPTQLQDLAKNIATHLDKARKSEEQAEQHYTAAAKYLAEAQAACDENGFKAFQEKFCPDIGRSRAYELLAVVRGKRPSERLRTALANDSGGIGQRKPSRSPLQ